ncbi:transposase, partial [Klebsiella variicola]|nr:transposase [Klebsiella pneumoniae]
AVFAVPAYGPQNDVTLKMPAFEWVHVQLHQQKGMISLSPPTICNSAQYSSGGKSKLGRITKAGDSYLRTLLVQGARSVLIGAGKRTDSFSRWVCMLVERRGYWRAVVAIAAKNARLCWASLHYGDDFRLYSVN